MSFDPDSPSDRADLASWRNTVCRHCKGLGYIPTKGEPMAADPCGWCDEAKDEPDPDAMREDRAERARVEAEWLRGEDPGLE